MGMGDTILKMSGIQKYFPGVHALDDAYLEVRAGEVMALVGENGAGKSTLMKILTGIYPKDGGTIEYFGQEIEIHGPKDAQDKGICIVHQELNLMQDLTVAENIFIGREPSKGPFLDQAAQNRMTEELFSSLNLRIPVRTQVKRLTVAKQQMVEIAKALSYKNTKVLIMDEPSTALTNSEIEDLFKFIRQLKATGVGIIYISHRMDELKQITDRITVMRDGQYVDTVETAGTTIDQVVQMMVGRVIYEEPKSHSNVPPDAEVVLEAEGLTSLDVKNVSFKLRKGEILGFAGLMGAGRTETMRLLCGADKLDGGTIKVRGREVKIASPKDAVNAGIGYLSEDRKLFGLCLGLDLVLIARVIPRRPRYLDIFLKPFLASALMGGAAWAVYGLGSKIAMTLGKKSLEAALASGKDPGGLGAKLCDISVGLQRVLDLSRTGNALITLGAIGIAVIVYGVLVLALRAISRDDLALMPKGDKIAKLLRL